MQKQHGNFLLQALLALTLVFAFLPFLAGKLSSRDREAKMYAAKEAIETVHTVARIYVREEKDHLSYGEPVKLVDKNTFSILEPYGLPMGFNPKTALGQDISLIIEKQPVEENAYTIETNIHVSGGNLSEIELKQLARMIGFYATVNMENRSIIVHVPFDIWDMEYYSVLVRREEPDPENAQFDVELDMDDHDINNVSNINAISVTGPNASFKNLNFNIGEADSSDFVSAFNIGGLSVTNNFYFYDADGSNPGTGIDAALYLYNNPTVKIQDGVVRSFGGYVAGEARTEDVETVEISYDNNGEFVANNWIIKNNTLADTVDFGSNSLPISFTKAGNFVVNAGTSWSGVRRGTVTEYVVTDRIYNERNIEGTAVTDLDIQPGGTTKVLDIYVPVSISSYNLFVDPFAKAGEAQLSQCDPLWFKTKYNIQIQETQYNSLLVNILCQYIFWERLERRMNYKFYCQQHPTACNTFNWP